MDVFNKFYSTVTNTVTQLSAALPGNPVTRDYAVTTFCTSAGPGLLWRVYNGYKKSTKQEAAIFVFEKKFLEKWNKGDRELILETLKSGVVQLTKLRHPNVLTVQHGLEESRESLAFATEPVFGSLAHIFGTSGFMPQMVHQNSQAIRNYELFEIEIKCGLMQIAEGLSFLHKDVKLLHCNITPESIMVNKQGAWKLFGFDFSVFSNSKPGQPLCWPRTEYCPAMPPYTQPSLDYLAPENTLSVTSTTASDVYSLGMLIYTIYNPSHQPLGNVGNDYKKHQKFVEDSRMPISIGRLSCITEELREYVKLMLNFVPVLRPDLHQFLKIPYFDDHGVKTLSSLDSLFQWDNLQKSQFFKSLPQVIQTMQNRICINRIIPSLAKEFVNPMMIPFVLPNVLLIAEMVDQEEYLTHILPIIKPIMAIKEPIQILLIFMSKIELLLKLTPTEDVVSDLVPMLYRALECDVPHIQVLCLSVIPTLAGLMDYTAMKNALLPRIKKLCLGTNSLAIRVNCLLSLGKLLEFLDKWLVLDEIVPFLQQIPAKEPAVIMAVLGIFKLIINHPSLGITREVMATKALPYLIPLCIENELTMNQFNALILLVKQMLTLVESEQRAKLAQLNDIKHEPITLQHAFNERPSDLIASPRSPTDINHMLAGLGMDTYLNNYSVIQKAPETAKSSIPSETCGDTPLSMEDKRRMAQQQEQQSTTFMTTNASRILNRAMIQSKPNTIDMTNKLINSNLSQLSTINSANSLASIRTSSSVPFMQAASENTIPSSVSQSISQQTISHGRLNTAVTLSNHIDSHCYIDPAPLLNPTSAASNSLQKQSGINSNCTIKECWSDFDALMFNKNKKNHVSDKESLDDMVDLLS